MTPCVLYNGLNFGEQIKRCRGVSGMFESGRCEFEPCSPSRMQEYCGLPSERNYSNAIVIADEVSRLLYNFEASHEDFSFSAKDSHNVIRRGFSVLVPDEMLLVTLFSQDKTRLRQCTVRVTREGVAQAGSAALRYEKEYSLTLLPGKRAIATVYDVDYGWSAEGESVELFHSARDMTAFDYDELLAELAHVEAIQHIESTDNGNVLKFAATYDLEA